MADVSSGIGAAGRRSARIALAVVLAFVLLFVALLALERSGPSPVKPPVTLIQQSVKRTTATGGATTTTIGGTPTTIHHGDCDDNDPFGENPQPPHTDFDPQGECVPSGV
jgi:hypothetical protein